MEEIEGIKPGWIPIKENAQIRSWKIISRANIEVDEGGVILNYDNVQTAGYNSDIELSFMYPVLEGRVLHSTEDALFYKAKYKIQDAEDIEGTYDDLASKLTTLYGKAIDNSEYNDYMKAYDPKAMLWTSSDGSLVWLAAYYDSSNSKYDECTITYMAPGAEEMLRDLSSQIQAEIYEDEASARDENATNTGGL